MGLVIFFIIAWIFISFFLVMRKGFPNRINLLNFISLQIFHINLFAIFSFKLKYFILSTNPVEFMSIILYRDLIIPIGLLIFINFLNRFKTLGQRIIMSGIILSLFLLGEQLLIIWKFISYRHWSFIHSVLFDSSLMIISVLLSIFFKRLLLKELKINGNLSNL